MTASATSPSFIIRIRLDDQIQGVLRLLIAVGSFQPTRGEGVPPEIRVARLRQNRDRQGSVGFEPERLVEPDALAVEMSPEGDRLHPPEDTILEFRCLGTCHGI